MKTSVLESLFNNIAGLKACNFIKKRLQHKVFSCKYCEIFKKIFFDRTSPVAVFVKHYLDTMRHSQE